MRAGQPHVQRHQPALEPNPRKTNRNTTDRVAGDSLRAAARSRRRTRSRPPAANTTRPSMIATNPAWVMPAYQTPASSHREPRTGARRAPAPAKSAPSAPTAPRRWSRSPPPGPASIAATNSGSIACGPRARPARDLRGVCGREQDAAGGHRRVADAVHAARRPPPHPPASRKSPESGIDHQHRLTQRQQVRQCQSPRRSRRGRRTPASTPPSPTTAGQHPGSARPSPAQRSTTVLARASAAAQATSSRPTPIRLIGRSAPAVPRSCLGVGRAARDRHVDRHDFADRTLHPVDPGENPAVESAVTHRHDSLGRGIAS